MMTQEERERALEAGRILNSSLFREVFEKLDKRYVSAWRNSTLKDSREEWWMMQFVLGQVKNELFSELQCAALKMNGKDETVNAALNAAKDL